MKINLGDYILEVDAERTRLTYEAIEQGGSQQCGCTGCKNYVSLQPKVLPNEVLVFFSEAGIDPFKDAEVYECGKQKSGLWEYGGEYYLWASVVNEPDTKQEFENHFEFTFMPPSGLEQEQFKSEGALCFYFRAQLPWVLNDVRS